MLFCLPKKRQLSFSERREDLRFSGNGLNSPNKFENIQVDDIEFYGELGKKIRVPDGI